MNRGLLLRLLICIFALGGFLYTYIDKQNDLTELKMEIPELAKQLRSLEEENDQLCLEIERLENPSHLIELLREKEYSHLGYPYVNEVVVLK
ncbi:hypothetical protein [Candidatus Neptunichlamydia sp. REUL1]|uniref:hypothetical protein n=1 Tax=Candidatus Neptunichlamydia sp. REUL1 TaxID=3064277 RepID=UPI00292E2FBB|nr:hypothetical protein [Candidatus Neptunochlamydia sp. REUL1]